jgi:HD-GYP domain-containing protein (c-di-GMP phosphodiesterase class II)
MFKMVPMSTLRIGAVLASPIFDQQNTKLLAPSIPITTDLLDKLRKRGISSVAVSEADLARLSAFQPQGTSNNALPGRQGIRATQVETTVSRQLDTMGEIEMDLNACKQGEAFSDIVQPRGLARYDAEGMNEFVEQHTQNVSKLDDMFASLATGQGADLRIVESISSDTLMRATQDMDLFVCMGITPAADSYPGRHSMHTAMLAMSIGATLGLDQRTLVELGLGCLIHDAGMLKIDEQSFQSKKVLSADEFSEITKHPLRTFDLLEKNLDQVPASARMVAYQMHERCDGSGYPRGRLANQIHPLAKIAGVADTFTALVSRRPHRAGMLPYHAMVKMLQDVGAGLYDGAIVRALLNTVSLFPIGSFVALSDGRVGKVIRANVAAYDRPMLEVWARADLDSPPIVIDLGDESQRELRVIRALSRLR